MCLHPSCQISHFHFSLRVCHDVWLPHQLLMRPLPSWSLSEPFCSTSWSMAVYSSSSTHVLLLAVSKQWSLIPSFWLVWHISMLLSSSSLQSKARVWGVDVLVCEDSRYLLKYWFVKAIPSCGGDHLHRHVQELHASTTSFISDFGCIIFMFMFSLVLSINSPNATSLHSRCIWEEVLRVQVSLY